MQRTLIEELKPGVIIAKDIHNYDGVMLVPKGTVFSNDLIKHVEKIGVREIYIEDDEQQEVTAAVTDLQKSLSVDNILCENTRIRAQQQIKRTMLKFNAVGRLQMDRIYFMVENIIGELLSKKDIVLSLSRLRSIDNYTYEHSLNVAVISLILGIDLNINQQMLRALGTGAVMHDIGKLLISEEILKKPSKLSNGEYEEIKKHTDYGYGILMESGVSEETAEIALNHHEKFDGTGYNRKLAGDRIPLLSRIVAVADVYDAMSNDRVYRKRLSPDFVYREIAQQAGHQFDAAVIEKLFRHLTIYPVGTGVILNTNHKGVVIAQNNFLPESPIIRVFKKETGSSKYVGVDIDLSRTKYLYIKDTF